MRLLHWLIALAGALLLGAWLAPLLGEDPGYVLVRFQGWAFEASVAAVALALVVLLLAWRLLLWVFRAPRRAVGRAVRNRREARLERGLLAMAEGRWSQAEKLLAGEARRSRNPSVHYLIAARAAQEREDAGERENYLALADESTGGRDLAVGLARAEMLMEDGHADAAAAVLEALDEAHPRNHRLLPMLAECYRSLERWPALRRLLPALRRVPGVDHSRLEREACRGAFQAADDPESLEAVWQSLGRRARRDPAILEAWAERAIALGDHERAALRLPPMLRSAWAEDLVRLYGLVRHEEPARALKVGEGWLREHPDDAVLLLTLGRLCRQAQLAGKARSYLERSLGHESRPETYRELAELLEAEGDTEGAVSCYRQVARLERGREFALAGADRPRLQSPGG